ncbi:RNA polymerase sigma-70 factor [Pedobacter yulinensis]|uniref:RNA polymerase sigma-70 factor n=1 Tax=Pedobacter yulinensis TaxID=2126353 RepID=A0A2T3HJC2_9SPHI|nr:RNA polymerase sigma-70 factor [Pedobacter yulinensis]PST82537.1 RNA polymerase sigma-70 factor [Pedobacter yulinensis]
MTTACTHSSGAGKIGESLYLCEPRAINTVQDDEQTRIEQIRNGQKNVFDQVFLDFYKHLHAYAMKMLRDHDAAEEAVQNVFCRIWERRSQLKTGGYLKSFLYRSVHNECLNSLKHQKVREAFQLHRAGAEAESASLDQDLHAAELQRHLQMAIEALPEKCREVFKLSRLEQLRYHEIAASLNISVKTVENQMGKALRVLRVKLADFLPLIFALLFDRL